VSAKGCASRPPTSSATQASIRRSICAGVMRQRAASCTSAQSVSAAPRLFEVYSEGTFIEATPDTCYFQIGESKYGKPVIDRVVHRGTSLLDATKCTIVSFDSTMRSNISVGLPIDLLVYETGSLKIALQRRIQEYDPYFQMVHHQWGEGLRRVFAQLPDPDWL
jgi:putative proteasome-type protease